MAREPRFNDVKTEEYIKLGIPMAVVTNASPVAVFLALLCSVFVENSALFPLVNMR